MLKVTLAIPVYNVEKFIGASLLSALNQTYPNIEYLVIDDRGLDNSMDIVKDIIKEHSRGIDVRIVEHNKNLGTGATRNSAIDYATGDYLYFLDGDDSIAENAISILVNKLDGRDIDVVEASFQKLSNDGEQIEEKVFAPSYYFGNFAICRWMEDCRKYYDGYPWNRLFSLNFLRRYNIRCFPNHRNEDVFFSFQIVIYAKSFMTIPSKTYNYFMRPGSTVHQKINEYYFNQHLEIFDGRTDLMLALEQNEKPMILNNYYLQHYFEWWLGAILWSDFSSAHKLLFYTHIRKGAIQVVNNKKNFVGIKYKILFLALRSKSFRPYQFLWKMVNLLLRMHNMINKRSKLFKVYNSWDII